MEKAERPPYWPSIERWMKSIRLGDALPKSIERQVLDVESFCKRIGPREVYTCADVTAFLSALEHEGCCGNTRQMLWYRLKGYFDANGWPWTLTKQDRPRPSPPRREFFTREEVSRLRAASVRDPTLHLAMGIASELMIRLVELTLLKRSEYRRPKIYVHAVKRSYSGWRQISPELCDEIEAYLRMRPTPGDMLLVDDDGAPVSTDTLRNRLRRLLDLLGMYRKQAGWHAFRRGEVTALHDAGMTEAEITHDVGWKTPLMVHEYIQLSKTKVEQKRLKLQRGLNGGEE